MPEAPLSEAQPLSPDRLAEIRSMRFTTRLNPAAGHFDTDTERELYNLAATCWNALQAVLRDHAHLTKAHHATAERLAQWEGNQHP
ncbi:hypothetical protein [Streptomyces sp. NPDC002952]|uniref:hypothetical protein n=1 Tax=Streptomyces sp. NPDC002952 TaxID=3364673 RepID=UPI00368F68CA